MNLNDPSGRLYPAQAGAAGQFSGQPPRAYPPTHFNTAMPPPGYGPSAPSGPVPGQGAMPSNLHPRLQLQMLLQIPLSGQRQPAPGATAAAQGQFSNMQANMQQGYRPPGYPPAGFQGNFSHPPPTFGRPRLLGGPAAGTIPGLGDTQDLERLRALENALKEASGGSWQPIGVPPRPAAPMMPPSNLDQHDANVARQAEAFIRELQNRGQMFDFKNKGIDPSRRRRHSSSSSGNSTEGAKKRRDDDSDLEEGEVQEDAPDTRFVHPSFVNSLPPPLFGAPSAPSVPPPFVPPVVVQQQQPDERLEHLDQRGRDRNRRNNNYRDLDAQDDESGQNASGTSGGEKSGGKNSFEKLFSAYLSHKAKTNKGDENPPQPSVPPASQPPDIFPLLKDMGPSIQQALSAVGIQVPNSLGPQAPVQQPTVPIATSTAPSLTCALSAFDRDIAQLGGAHPHQLPVEPPRPLGIGLPSNVSVEFAPESSDLAAIAEEITASIDKHEDQVNIGQEATKEMFPNRDNRATVVSVQKMIPLIPMIERENVVKRATEGPDYSNTPLLLPSQVLEEHVIPPTKDSKQRNRQNMQHRQGRKGQAQAAPGWSKSELVNKTKQARERINHLKIEQAMVEERLVVMGDELSRLHRYFESNYGVKLVRPSDLEDPAELTALWKRREEEAKRKELEALVKDEQDESSEEDEDSAPIFGPERFTGGDDSNNLPPDENGIQGDTEEGEVGEANSPMQEDSKDDVLPLKDEGNQHEGKKSKRGGGQHWRSRKARQNMRSRIDAPDRRGRRGGGGPQRGGSRRQ